MSTIYKFICNMYILFIYTAFEDLMRVDCKENLLRSTPDVLKTQVYIKNK